MGIAEPQVARVRGIPPSVPEGLKATALKDPDLLEPASDYPVVKWGNYTYWPLSYVDNRYAMCVVAYDGASSKAEKDTHEIFAQLSLLPLEVLASKPASQLWRLKPFISSPDISTDQFPLLVPGEPFALSNLSQQLLTSSGSGRPLTCNKSNGRPSANQYWVYNGAGGLLNAHDQLAVTHSTAPPASYNSPVIASPWTGSPQQQWLLTSDGYFLCRANNKVLTSNASAGTVALVDYEPLGSTDQRWFLAKRRDKRSLPPASTKVTKLKVIARVSDDLFAGTSDVIYITFSPPGSGYLATLFDGPSRGDVATINIDIQRMFGKSEINLLEDIPTVLIYQAEKSAIFSDDWKLASITMMGSTNEGEDFTNYTFQKVDKWLGVNASQFHIGALKLVWSSSIPWGAWLDKNRKPIDLNSQTYPVGWMPYIGDLKSWRTYDPSQIDGVGYLIGMRHGKLIGELLKTRQTEILQPSSDKHSYTWVFTPSGAIIYKLWDKDVDLSEYVRHSQLGSGNPVICAGEMKIRKAEENNYVVTDMIAIINDASGHYKPDGGACLRYVGKKLQELGIPTYKTSWYSRKP